MAQIVLTNLSASPLPLADLGSKSLAVGESVTITRPANLLANMLSVVREVAAGTLSATVTPSAAELASGLLAPPQSVQAEDLAPVASTVLPCAPGAFYKAISAGGGGSADDVTLYAVNTLPYKIRVLRAYMRVATPVSGSNCQLRSAAAGGGTLVSQFDTAAVGQKEDATVNATVVLTPGTLVGLFLRRSDSAVAGEVVIEFRRES